MNNINEQLEEELDEEEWFDQWSFKDVVYDLYIKEDQLPNLNINEDVDKKGKPISVIDNEADFGAQKYHDSTEKEVEFIENFVATEWDMKAAMELSNIKKGAIAERLLDKIATKKEFMNRLWDKGDILKKAADRIHDLLDNPNWKAYKAGIDVVMKFTWLDKPDDGLLSTESWEETVKAYNKGKRDAKIEQKQEAIDITNNNKPHVIHGDFEIPEYEVEEPPIPESVKRQIEADEQLGQSLFGEKI